MKPSQERFMCRYNMTYDEVKQLSPSHKRKMEYAMNLEDALMILNMEVENMRHQVETLTNMYNQRCMRIDKLNEEIRNCIKK